MDMTIVLVTAMRVHKVVLPTVFTASKTKGTSLCFILQCDKFQEKETKVLNTFVCPAISYSPFQTWFTGAMVLPISMGVQALPKNICVEWVFLCAMS